MGRTIHKQNGAGHGAARTSARGSEGTTAWRTQDRHVLGSPSADRRARCVCETPKYTPVVTALCRNCQLRSLVAHGMKVRYRLVHPCSRQGCFATLCLRGTQGRDGGLF